MNTGKVRIYELSKELNLDNRDILAICDQLNISVKSHASLISEAEAASIRSAADKYTPSHSYLPNKLNVSAHSTNSQQPRKASSPPPVKKQQILEIRRNRPLVEPPRRPSAPITALEPPRRPGVPITASQKSERLIRRTPRTGQGYIEPLPDVGTAIPLHMVLIPGGSFTMGSPDDELERDKKRESPQHEVTVPPFFMGRYPVTQAQWRAVAGLPQVKRELVPDPSRFKGDNRPVERVSWHDAIEFCARLENHTNRPYRLPTEAEWEYACRAGTTTPFYFGAIITPELANYAGTKTYNNSPQGEYRQETTPVDYFEFANGWGLSDMHGNVWEWCHDHWHDSYEDAPTDGSAWIDGEASENARRVNRGGSWFNAPKLCRSAMRDYSASPRAKDHDVGFRVCCSAPAT